MAKFFVVVPVWNGAQFLSRTLDSVLMQDLGEHSVHLHVQDAASTDSTMDEIRAFASRAEAGPNRQNLIVTYASEEDAGMYDAIQKGLDNWSRRVLEPGIFFWLNADDLLMPDAINNISKAFAVQAVRWIIGEGVDIDENDRVLYRKPHKQVSLDQLQSGDFNYTGSDWIRAESTAVRYDAMTAIGKFDTHLRMAGDHQLFMKLARISAPVYCNFALRAFRKHDAQLSKAAIKYQHERSRTNFFSSKRSAIDDAAPDVNLANVQVVFYPDYTSGNSYQKHLYLGVKSYGASSLTELSTLASSHPQAVLHLHWLNQITRMSRDNALRGAQELREIVSAARLRGQAVMFTVHNIASHEGDNLDIEESLVKFLFDECRVVHVHHPVVSVQVQERYKAFPWGRIVVAEHGPYPFEKPLSRQQALARVGLTDDSEYCVIPGQIRAYKDLDFQMLLLTELRRRGIVPGKLRVILAGVIHPEVTAEQQSHLRRLEGVHIPRERLDDLAFSSVMHHARFVLLCYRDISTSGSLFHALSVGAPVVAPRLGTIPSYLFEAYNGELYDAGNVQSAVAAIDRCLSHEPAELAANALQSVAHLSWRKSLNRLLARVV